MCQNCDESEEEMKKDWVELRYIGGRHKKYPYRGPYLTYETGKIYLVPPYNRPLPYWEEVDETAKDAVEVDLGDIEAEDEVVESEAVEANTVEEVSSPSAGLTKAFSGAPPTEKDFIMGMDIRTLRGYIEGQGGEVDGRWGLDTLREEALKLQ